MLCLRPTKRKHFETCWELFNVGRVNWLEALVKLAREYA